jgi:hypothetical protein
LFLDEIGDLPLELQTKLLRLLQEGTFERLGSSQTQKVDVRIIAATHRDLRRMIGEGTFREDLYYRLSVFPIRLPPLRERREDIPKLVRHVIQKHERTKPHRIKHVPESVMEELQRRSWPGNIRELENVIEGALIHSTGDVLTLLDSEGEAEPAPAEDPSTLSAVERTHIQEVLRACGWRINGAGNAAERLGLIPIRCIPHEKAGHRPRAFVARERAYRQCLTAFPHEGRDSRSAGGGVPRCAVASRHWTAGFAGEARRDCDEHDRGRRLAPGIHVTIRRAHCAVPSTGRKLA